MTRIIRIFLPLLLLAVAVGCGSSKKSGVITGKVTYNGAVVPGGTVSFHRTIEGLAGAVGGTIEKDGTYTVLGVPPGEMIVTVDTEFLNPDGAKSPQEYGKGKNKRGKDDYRKKQAEQGNKNAGAAAEPDPSRYVKVPSKYNDKKTSTLKMTVKTGSNSYNIEMTD